MNVSGKVVQVAIDVDVKKNGGGTYKGWKLVYEQSDGEIKTIQKHMNSLKYAVPLANGLKELNAGDMFTMELEKEGDFWNPKSIFKGEAAPANTVTKSQSTGSKPTVAATGSTYATKEERAQTQKYIVRQSSITAALKLLELQGKKTVDQFAVIVLAEQFESWVMGKSFEVIIDADTDITDMNDDMPF